MPLRIEEYGKEIEKRRLLSEQYDAIKDVPKDIQLQILTLLGKVVESIKKKKQRGEKVQVIVKSS